MVSGSCKQSPQAPINLLFSLLSGMDKKKTFTLTDNNVGEIVWGDVFLLTCSLLVLGAVEKEVSFL